MASRQQRAQRKAERKAERERLRSLTAPPIEPRESPGFFGALGDIVTGTVGSIADAVEAGIPTWIDRELFNLPAPETAPPYSRGDYDYFSGPPPQQSGEMTPVTSGGGVSPLVVAGGVLALVGVVVLATRR